MPNTEIEIGFYEVRELNPNKNFFSKCNYEYSINSPNEFGEFPFLLGPITNIFDHECLNEGS